MHAPSPVWGKGHKLRTSAVPDCCIAISIALFLFMNLKLAWMLQ